MIDICNKDKKIIYALDSDSRKALNLIAKDLGISTQNIYYRYNHMIKNNIINKALAVIDFSKFGYSAYKCHIAFYKIGREKINNIISYLQNHSKVFYLGSVDGQFNLVVTLLAKSGNDVSNDLDKFNEKYSSFIKKLEIKEVLEGEYFAKDYLLEKKTRKNPKKIHFGSVGSNKEKLNIDQIDFHILKELAKDAKTKSSQIAKKTPISADAISLRIKKLEQAKIIQHYVLLLNSEKIHIKLFTLHLTFQNITLEKKGELKRYLISNPNVIFINKMLGSWSMEVNFEVLSNNDFREILMDLNDKFGNIIKDYFVLNIYDVHKYNFFPFDDQIITLS